nr:VOC family protein [Burkholderia mayonis]
MSELSATIAAMRPFIAARDFELSKRFYLDLGFTLSNDSQDAAVLTFGSHSILLQNYYEVNWAENTMLQIVVTDLDIWWQHIVSLKLDDTYAVKAPIAPKVQPWGLRVAYVYDPSGVLWHSPSPNPPDRRANGNAACRRPPPSAAAICAGRGAE